MDNPDLGPGFARVVADRLDGTMRVLDALRGDVAPIDAVVTAVARMLHSGGTLYTCGNGGSAAEAMHLAEELVGRYQASPRPAMPAVCLSADPAALTCIANDFGFERVFARQCEALLDERDALLVLSTSGNSPNLVAALETARDRGATTIGLLGRDGGRCRDLCDHALVVASDDSAHVQEAHLIVIHLICEALETR